MKRTLIIFLLGALTGTAVGLYLGWFAFPVQLVEVLPADLAETDQADYLILISATYVTEQNLVAAQSRLASLGREDWREFLLSQTVDAILNRPREIQTENLVRLSLDLGLESPAFAPYEALFAQENAGGSE